MPVTKEDIQRRIQKKLDSLPHASDSRTEQGAIIEALVEEIATLHEIIEEQDEKFQQLEDHLFPRGVSQP